ncbi:hypothetical protein HY948_04340, partial [Candidatus Gottesmanbacteria bacterium]|nr:hypothetical protein [Candidatus Gottesmanbacteria bacterium]
EFEEKSVQYEEAIGGYVRLRGAKFNKIPCLVIPTEYMEEAGYVLKVLINNGYISSFRTDKSSYICVIEYRYVVPFSIFSHTPLTSLKMSSSDLIDIFISLTLIASPPYIF